MLEIKNLSFSYHDGKKEFPVFNNVTFTIKDNEFFCIIGPSGCGKSTLIKVIAGFERPNEGSILEDGKEIKGISHERAMVFQEDAVFPWLTVLGNIEYGLKSRGISSEQTKEKSQYYLNLVDLNGCDKIYPRQLSGGMRKRVDLARVLANDPRILLMDEPFGSLDAITKEMLQVKLIEIWELSKKTVIFITHDVEEALFLGDRVAIMQPVKYGTFKIFDVPFKRPRELKLKEDAEFQHMRRNLLDEFQHIDF